MRVLYAGTPGIAVPGLAALARRHEVVGVLTNPDRGTGRGRKVRFSPVKEKALELGLRVVQPETLRAEARERVASLDSELLVCVAYGKIFGPKFLALFRRGGINMHPSLLPRHRGPAPIPAAILAGDRETGITIQQLAREMDAGDILLQEKRLLRGRETAGELTAWAAEEGARLLVEAVDLIEAGREKPVPQDPAKATYCSLLSKEESWIDWGEPVMEIDRRVRAFNPWPLARTSWGSTPLIIHEAAPAEEGVAEAIRRECRNSLGVEEPEAGRVLGVDKLFGILVQTGVGALGITRLQAPARKPMTWDAFLNGNPELVSALLGASKESETK
ncbi:MAG: methionyl-tRNA formyltransferase [Alkalispirochaetaceae bacterium]